MGALYRVTAPSGKAYVGITSKTTELRWEKHKEHALGKRASGALYAALRKYGCESFEIETLVVADDWGYLCELEKKAINVYGTKAPFGYNLTDGGEGVLGPRDEATKIAISIAQKKRFENPEQRVLMAQYATKNAEATKNRHAAKRINGLAPWEQRKREGALRNGSPEHRALVSERTKAAMATPEVRAKLAASVARMASDPEWRAKISKSKTGKRTGPRSEATRLKQSEAMKAAWAKRKALND
jgi:hypothetical protein